jgi:hypothetical protein
VTRPEYKPDSSKRSGMGGFIMNDERLQRAMLIVANQGQAHAESIAPVDTGDYAGSFHVSDDSVGATLYNDANHAALVEYERGGPLAKTADYLNKQSRRRRR